MFKRKKKPDGTYPSTVRVVCFILVALMVLGGSAIIFYTLLS